MILQKIIESVRSNRRKLNSLFDFPGDYLVVGTDQPVVRMYDTNTGACFVGAIPSHQVRQRDPNYSLKIRLCCANKGLCCLNKKKTNPLRQFCSVNQF